jgi:hypothetical protein
MARGLTWQTLQFGLTSGLETKGDARAASPPALDIARDVQAEEIGGLQTRPPFSTMSNDIFGGGDLANCRRLSAVNDELVLFTDDELYSWNAQLAAWILRGTHLACTVDETPRFEAPGDQIGGDRAELNGTIINAWVEGAVVFAAATDKTTGSVLVSPTAVSTAIDRPKLVALGTTILLFTQATSTSLTVRAINPASPGAGIAGAGTSVMAANFNANYDVVKAGTQDLAVGVARRSVTTSYEIFRVTPALAVTTATKARTADGPLAVASIPDGTQTQVVRQNGANVQGDLLTTSTLADVFTNSAIAGGLTNVQQIAVAFSTVASGGFFTATVFLSLNEASTGTGGSLTRNTITNNNVVGSAVAVAPRLGVASRAFAALGRVFVWGVFARENEITGLSGATAVGVRAALQNTYFLYRDDGLLVGKALFAVAGGHLPSFGCLPTVAPTSDTGLDFAWCAARRRLIDLGSGNGHTGYAARSPVEVAFSFDSDRARRTAALGRTLYVADSIPLQYDGAALVEVGFLIYPFNFFVTNGGAGSIVAGDYVYKSTLAWPNAKGEIDYSTTAVGAKITAPGANRHAIQVNALNVTRRSAATTAPAMRVWRTTVDPLADTPFFQVTGNDPALLAGTVDNGYIPNNIAASVLPSTGAFVLNDTFADTTLTTKESNPENGLVLEYLAPPGASIIVATDTRLFLAGVSGDPDAVWYSRERREGEVASFHDTLRVEVPRNGGDITSIWFQDEVLYVARETAIYALPGVGLDNLGQGQNFGPARIVSLDVGCVSHDAQALTPVGTLFRSNKGWCLLDRGGGVRYVGAPVAAFDADTVRACHVMTSKHHVRVLTSGRILVWDYRGLVDAVNPDGTGQWFEWTISDGVHATMWQGRYVYLTATGPKIEETAMTGLTYGIDVETPWVKMNDLQGWGKLGAILALGEWRSDFLLRIRVARDYQYDGAGNPVYFDDKVWNPSPTTVGSVLQVRHSPTQPQGQAFKVRLTAVSEAERADLVTTSLSPQVETDGAVWTATWLAADTHPGEMGNRLTMSVAFAAFVAPGDVDEFPYSLPFEFVSETGSVMVKDHFTWSPTLERWREDEGNIGVLVAGEVTVGDLETAIAAASSLATLGTPDASPSKAIDASDHDISCTASFTGGTYGTPTGEACKLTGLAFEVGIDPRAYKRLPAEQKQ